MVGLKVYLSDGLNEKFRRIAMSVYGYGRGSLSKAAEEAFARWCAEHDGPGQETNPADILEVANRRTGVSGINPDERPRDGEKPGTIGENGTSNKSNQADMGLGATDNRES